MRHRQIRKQLAADIRRLLKNKKSLPVILRDYQEETFESTLKWLRNPNGTKRGYVTHATGLGKTVLFSTLVSATEVLTCLVIVPNRLLVQQTVREIVKFTGGSVGHVSTAGKIKDEEGEIISTRGHHGQRIVVTTDASFKLYAAKFAMEFKPHVIIRDECHWSYSEKSVDALALFPNAVIIGYSATPDYLTTTARQYYVPVTLDNGQTLYAPPDRIAQAHFGTMLDRRTLRWGIEHEHLAPLAWGTISFDFSLDDVPVTEGPAGTDYDEQALHELLAKNWQLMEDVICQLYRENQYTLQNRQVFAMCPGVAQAESLARKLSRFVKTACITGGTPDDERDRILASFDKDKPGKDDIRFVASVFVLREGWNARNAEVCMMLRPTRSRVLYEQFMGRGLRKRRDGKSKVALVLDAHFQGTTFSPLSAPVLYGIPGERIAEGGILIAPPRRRRGGRAISPYMLKGVKPRLHVVTAAEIDHWAGGDGFFQADGEWWGSRKALSQKLKIDDSSITSRANTCRERVGKDRIGHPALFYCLSDMEKACADLLETPLANAEGFFEARGEWWGTKRALARRMRFSDKTINSRVSLCRSYVGRMRWHGPSPFYCLSDMEKACADLLETPLANAEGFFEARGEWWGTALAIAGRLGVGQDAVGLRGSSCRSCKGRVKGCKPTLFYCLSDMQKVCANMQRGRALKK